MASTHLSAAELLALEERQLRYYLGDAPAWASAWLREPAPHLPVACWALAAQLPHTIERILARVGSPEAFAQRLRRVLSPASAPQIAGAALRCTWAREMRLDAEAPIDDERCGNVLRFCYDVARHYRSDGEPHPDDAAGLGSNYRILREDDAAALARRCRPLDRAQSEALVGLIDSVSALSMHIEAGTRAGLMMHGPYPTGLRDVQLVVFECSDLREAQPLFPLPDLAVAMQVRDVDVQADRFGTLHLQPWDADVLVSACVLAHDEADGLADVPLPRVGELRRRSDEIRSTWQHALAGWSPVQRDVVALWQEQKLLCRLLTAAGFEADELDAARRRAEHVGAPLIERHLMNADRQATTRESPFFAKLRDFMAGTEPHLFTPFDAGAGAREPRRGPMRATAA